MAKSKSKNKSRMAFESKAAKTAKGVKGRGKKQKGMMDIILDLLANPKIAQEKKDEILSLLAVAKSERTWEGYRLCPPGSVIDTIVQLSERYCDAPLDLPFVVTMTLLSAVLVRMGVTCNIGGSHEQMTIWMTVLGESSSCKSFTLKKISALLDCFDKDLIWQTKSVSRLQFLEEWRGIMDKNGNMVEPSRNRSAFVQDEATEFLADIKNPRSPMFGVYRDLLMSYGHDPVGYKSKASGSIYIENPVISVLFLATPERFLDQLSSNDIEGGFFYRFNYLICSKSLLLTKKRKFPNDMFESVKPRIETMIQSIVHSEYVFTNEADSYLDEIWEKLVAPIDRGDEGAMPKGLVRRMVWAMYRFAVLYHILLGRGHEKFVGVEACSYAERLLYVFNQSAGAILQGKMGTESQTKLARVESIIERRMQEGKPTSSRDLINAMRELTAQEAKLYLEIAASKYKAQGVDMPRRKVGGAPKNAKTSNNTLDNPEW